MYPFIRFVKDILIARRQPPLAVGDTHVSHHICWPWDLDFFAELNNGRMLTLYDLGRFGMAQRGGLIDALLREKWTLTVAGSLARYRRRVTVFERLTVRSRFLCWDDRFMYLEQSMWKRDGECASHVVYRTAALEKGKLLPPERVARAIGYDGEAPPMPAWIRACFDADNQRPWPPMQDDQSS